MSPRSERFETRDGVSLSTRHWDDARGARDATLLLLLHGGGANACWWDHLAPSLVEGRRAVALDFRGHGDSDYPDTLEDGAFEADVADVVHWLGSDSPVVIGHSMGAAVALRYAASSAPRALVLLDPARGLTRSSGRRLRLALTLGRHSPSKAEAVERYRFLPDAPYASESLRRSIAENSVMPTADGRFAYKFDPRWFGGSTKRRPPTEHIHCPVLILRGEESEVLTAEGLAGWQEDLPQAETGVIEGAGHHLQLDQPQRTLDAILAFLHRVA